MRMLAALTSLATMGLALGVGGAQPAAGRPAQAAPTWSTPATLARGPHGASFGASVQFAPGGAGAIAWQTELQALRARSGSPGARRSAATRAVGFGGLLATYGWSGVVSLPQSGAVAVDTSLSGGRLRKAPLGAPAGSLLAAAANEAGEVAVVYQSCAPCKLAQPLIRLRAPGAAVFGPQRALLARSRSPRQGGPTVASVAVAPDGTVLVAWIEQAQRAAGPALSNVVYARVLSPGGRPSPGVRLSPTARLGGGGQFDQGAALVTAFGPHGEPLVAFESDGEGCEAPGPVTVRAAIGDARGRFAPARLLGSFPSVALDGYCLDSWGPRYPSAVLGLVGGARPLLVWTGAAHGRLVVRAASLSLGRFREAVTVSPPDGQDQVLAALAATPRGGASALWLSFPRGVGALGGSPQARLLAASSLSGAAFGAPQAVAPRGGIRFPASLGVDPVSGRAVAAWTAFGGGPSRLRYATRA